MAVHRVALIVLIAAVTTLTPDGRLGAEPVVPRQGDPIVGVCPDPVDPVDLTGVAQVEQLLVGTWVRCGDEGLLPPAGPGNEVGIEFVADGAFYRVYEEGGELIRTEGLEQQGDWTLLDNGGGTFQLNLGILGSGTAITTPEFYGTPTSLLRTPTTAGPLAEFVPWSGAPPVPGIPTGLDEGPCGLPTDPVELTSVTQVEQLLVGTWVRCSVDSAIGPVRPGEVGIEITADGRFFRLYDDGASGLILASGGEEEGTWKVIDTTAMNGPGVYQLDFTITGTFPGTATFLQQPTHFRFISFPTADYQPWDGEPPTPPVPPVSEPPPATPNPPPTTDGSLPPTGANSVTVWLALMLLACGIGLSVASRRGHRSRPETSLRPSG